MRLNIKTTNPNRIEVDTERGLVYICRSRVVGDTYFVETEGGETITFGVVSIDDAVYAIRNWIREGHA